MATRVKKVLAGIAALAALAFGGAAIAQAGGNSQSTPPATSEAVEQGESNAPENSAGDTDNIQDETGNDQGEEADGPENSAGDTDNIQDETGNDQGEERGSEVTGDDGPGGHADEA